MKRLFLWLGCLSLIFMTGCGGVQLGWAPESDIVMEDDGRDELIEGIDGPLGGEFDAEGNWIPDDPTIEATYRIPDISAGFMFDARTLETTPTIQIELFEFGLPWKDNTSWKSTFPFKYLSTWKVDAGVGYQRLFGYVGVRLTSIFEISVGAVGGWNWDTNDYFYGPAFTVIKF